jgi:AraC family transcriptional regulator, regulatory protein of adaptative response / DNA-3-methyladenine glycosylase II
MEPDHELRLPYRSPCDVEGVLEFLAARAVAGVEQVTDGAYRRGVRLPQGAGVIGLKPDDGAVLAQFWLEDPSDLEAAVEACRRLLDLDRNPEPIRAALGGDELIGSLVQATPGRRVPGSVDGAEIATHAVLGQQISVPGAAKLAARLVAAFGGRLERPVGAVTHLFPAPAVVAAADPARLPMPAARRRALIGLAEALAGGQIVLDGSLTSDEVEGRLLALPGSGPWTTSYIAMRALGDADAFLPTDLGVRHALELLGCDGRPPAAARVAERWRPYRAYAMQHLWAHLVSDRHARVTSERARTDPREPSGDPQATTFPGLKIP